MKTACAVVISVLAFLLSACVTGDKITSYVIEPDGSIFFSIYRLNLTSDQEGDKAKKELADYIREHEEKSGDFFARLTKANAKEVNVTILRKASPASVLITGRFTSVNDFAAYTSEEDEDSKLVCTSIARERTRGIQCELTWKPSKAEAPPEKEQPVTIEARANSFDEVRVSVAEGVFTRAQGYILSSNKRSALFDEETLVKLWDSKTPSISTALEWQIPDAP